MAAYGVSETIGITPHFIILGTRWPLTERIATSIGMVGAFFYLIVPAHPARTSA